MSIVRNTIPPPAETRGGASSALAPLRYRGHPLALGGGSSSPVVNRSRPPSGHAPPAGYSVAMAAALPHDPRVSECLGRSIAAARLAAVRFVPLAPMLRSRGALSSRPARTFARSWPHAAAFRPSARYPPLAAGVSAQPRAAPCAIVAARYFVVELSLT